MGVLIEKRSISMTSDYDSLNDALNVNVLIYIKLTDVIEHVRRLHLI